MKRRIVFAIVIAVCLSAAAVYAFGGGRGSTSAASAASKPASVGIKVHGRWILEVRSRTGRLVSRRTFENALQPFGAETLAGLLNGEWSVSGWGIGLGGAFTNGGISNATTSRNGGAFIVSGSAVANADTSITDVQTVAGRSGGQGISTITFKSLVPAVQVLSGQQVLAKVTITFS
jgi:hypothetical protein